MRPPIAGLLISLIVLAACGGDEEQTAVTTAPAATATTPATPGLSTAPPTPTPTVSPMPLPSSVGQEPSGFEAFRRFAREVHTAIGARDTSFFIDRGVEVELVCVGDEQLGPCADEPAGTVKRGIPGSAWRSDAWAIFTDEEYVQNLERYFDSPIVDAADGYGTGDLRLFALAARDDEGKLTFMAISTAIVDVYPSTGYPIGQPQREAHVFEFEGLGEDWGFAGERAAVVSATAAEWLSASCSECYDYWELWQGVNE